MITIKENIMNLDDMQNALAMLSKKIKKRFGRDFVIDIYLVGGASMLFNSYRNTTQDIDAYLNCDKYDRQDILTLIYEVSDELNLSKKWLNDDFKNTESFTNKLKDSKCCYFEKTYNQCLNLYVIKPIYILCMKLLSFREDTNDIEDIITLCKNNEFRLSEIKDAFHYLYNKDINTSLTDDSLNLLKLLWQTYM